jgi:integrase
LPIQKKPIFLKIAHGIGLGYRRNQTNGTWIVRVANGAGGAWTRAFAAADDYQDADGQSILTFWDAQAQARAEARIGGGAKDEAPLTVARALQRYRADLKARGGDTTNAGRVECHLPESLAGKKLAFLTDKDLEDWRNDLAREVCPSTVNRIMNAFRAALNLAAPGNTLSWKKGLKAIGGVDETRNVILEERQVRAIVAEAYRESAAFGLLIELAAITGSRMSQLRRLRIRDVQLDGPRLMVPTSHKGSRSRKVTHKPVPIPAGLAARLPTGAPDSLLLLKPSGRPWTKGDHLIPFARAAKRAGLDPGEVTSYALRHTNIVRQLLANVPIRVVAANHDTSVLQIERTYSRFIGDRADSLVRPALLDLTLG